MMGLGKEKTSGFKYKNPFLSIFGIYVFSFSGLSLKKKNETGQEVGWLQSYPPYPPASGKARNKGRVPVIWSICSSEDPSMGEGFQTAYPLVN